MKIVPIALALAVTLAPASALAQSDEAKAQMARENFKQADRNKDAKLSKSEFRAFINANAKDGLGKASMVKRFGAYDRAFASLDKNKDGQITRQELIGAMKK